MVLSVGMHGLAELDLVADAGDNQIGAAHGRVIPLTGETLKKINWLRDVETMAASLIFLCSASDIFE